MKSKRTQAERNAATRSALLTAARRLFAAGGYAAVGTDEIARAAGVSRGALYHQFGGKLALFTEVCEQLEAGVAAQITADLARLGTTNPKLLLHTGIDAWLAACAEPDVHRIMLLEAPAVLGWEGYREICLRHGVGLIEATLSQLMRAGNIAEQPARPLALVLAGALDEAALYAARTEQDQPGTETIRHSLYQLIDGLITTDQ